MNQQVYLDPTGETDEFTKTSAPRLNRLEGVIGLLDISKPRGDVFLAEFARLLSERNRGVSIRQYRKPTFTKPCPPDLLRSITQDCDAVVLALAD